MSLPSAKLGLKLRVIVLVIILQLLNERVSSDVFSETKSPNHNTKSEQKFFAPLLVQPRPRQSSGSLLKTYRTVNWKRWPRKVPIAPDLSSNSDKLVEKERLSKTLNRGRVLFPSPGRQNIQQSWFQTRLFNTRSDKNVDSKFSVIRFVKPSPTRQNPKLVQNPVQVPSVKNTSIGNVRVSKNDLVRRIRNLRGRQFDFPGDITNPETFNAGSSVEGEVYQIAIGGRCYLPQVPTFPFNTEGTCQSMENCPHLQPLAKQLQYGQTIEFLLQLVCRFDGDRIYFCCNAPTYSVLDLPTIVDLPARSPVPAPIPGPQDCGKVFSRPARIIGGENVTAGEFPWLAVLGEPSFFTSFLTICSGSLITRRHVMTAAHCFRGSLLEAPTRVRLGELDLNANTEVRHQEYIITSWHAPLYYFYYTINDIMLVTLDRDVIFNDYIQPGCLPFSNPTAPQPGDELTAAGYGLLADNFLTNERSRYPQKLDVPVVDNTACQSTYYDIPGIYVIDDRVFCSGGLNGSSTCRGDSGGPLHLFDDAMDRELIVGITNAGALCGSPEFPRIDLRVGAFLPWIQSVVGGV